jgi:hypothetical protein
MKDKSCARSPPQSYNILDDITHVLIGSKVSLWWESEAKYIDGLVTNIRKHIRPFYVVYNGGVEGHWVDLVKYRFKLIDDESVSKLRKSKVDNQNKNKKTRIFSQNKNM